MKVRFYGDICYPGVVEVEVEDLDEARELASKSSFTDEETQFTVHDKQGKCLAFIPAGEIFDEDGNEIE